MCFDRLGLRRFLKSCCRVRLECWALQIKPQTGNLFNHLTHWDHCTLPLCPLLSAQGSWLVTTNLNKCHIPSCISHDGKKSYWKKKISLSNRATEHGLRLAWEVCTRTFPLHLFAVVIELSSQSLSLCKLWWYFYNMVGTHWNMAPHTTGLLLPLLEVSNPLQKISTWGKGWSLYWNKQFGYPSYPLCLQQRGLELNVKEKKCT